MKTIKILLSILGVALLTLSFGQLLAQTNNSSDLNMAKFVQAEEEVLFYIAHYNAEEDRTIHLVNHLPGEAYPFAASVGYNTPPMVRTYFAREVKADYEDMPVLESWMMLPFKSSLEEAETGVEDWMITPFETGIVEEDLQVESWMTAEWL